jgi:hypothetical protein
MRHRSILSLIVGLSLFFAVYSVSAAEISLTGSSTTCDSAHAGALRWTGTAFQGCNGSSWSSLAGGGASLPNCASGELLQMQSSGSWGCGNLYNDQVYTTAGSYSWTVPAGVSKVSVVVIGPGGVCHSGSQAGASSFNNSIYAYGGFGNSGDTGGAGGSGSGGDGGGNGGSGTTGSGGDGVGGNAGGYSSNGADGGNTGTGLYGLGSSGPYGSGGAGCSGWGGPGGGGLRWANNINVTAGASIPVVVGSGGNGGAVRIMWGPGRSFPSNAN